MPYISVLLLLLLKYHAVAVITTEALHYLPSFSQVLPSYESRMQVTRVGVASWYLPAHAQSIVPVNFALLTVRCCAAGGF